MTSRTSVAHLVSATDKAHEHDARRHGAADALRDKEQAQTEPEAEVDRLRCGGRACRDE
jgi:hypothetical protein